MKRNYQDCAAVAAQYLTSREFKLNSNSEYQWLSRNNLLAKACAHIIPLRRNLSDDDIAEIAAKYTHRRVFKLGDQSAYQRAIERGIIDGVCAHMDIKYRNLTNEEIEEVAKKFKSRSDFDRLDQGAYQTAARRGILDQVCSHMDSRGCRRLSDEEIMKIASSYTARRDFKLGDFGAYITASRCGNLESACAHMGESENGFNPCIPAVLYCIQFNKPNGEVLYKVGITNRTAKIRLRTLGLLHGVKASILREIKFKIGADARAKEKAIHNSMAEYQYLGDPIMENGNTEVFCRDAIKYM